MDNFAPSPSMLAALDHPVWSALGSGHRACAGRRADRRYPRDVGPFAAQVDARPGFTVTALDPVRQMAATRDPGPATG